MFLVFLLLFFICVILPVVAIYLANAAFQEVRRLHPIVTDLRSRLVDLEESRSPEHQEKQPGLGSSCPTLAKTSPKTGTATAPPTAVVRPPVRTGTVLPPARPAQSVPAPAQSGPSAPPPQPRRGPTLPSFDWEGFTGARLFAWMGGLALFLGFVFLVKLTIDQGLLSPAVRIALGTVAGLALIISGLQIKRNRYRVTAHTLCAAGVAILHVVTFAAHQFYDFLGAGTAFPLLAMITAVAFLLAARLDSRYIALLGLLGGFLNPYLVSSGQDRPFALFGYLAILDIGLIMIAVRKKWAFLVPMSALGTTFLQMSWVTSSRRR